MGTLLVKIRRPLFSGLAIKWRLFLRRSVAVNLKVEKKMAEVLCREGLEAVRGDEAIVAFLLCLVWQRFQKNLSFYLLLFFDDWCYWRLSKSDLEN